MSRAGAFTMPHAHRYRLAARSAALALYFAVAAWPAGAAPAKAAGIEGVVAKVIDGDSLVVQPKAGAPIEVRLRDMDAPEICQAGGPEAKAMLERLALGKEAKLVSAGRDTYGRTVGAVTVEGQSLSKLMVAEGHAWSARSRFDRGPLMKEERMAIALKRGLHAAGGAQNPKDFRKAHGPCK
jgi:endonuclease YncB( thermonuclease family)